MDKDKYEGGEDFPGEREDLGFFADKWEDVTLGGIAGKPTPNSWVSGGPLVNSVMKSGTPLLGSG